MHNTSQILIQLSIPNLRTGSLKDGIHGEEQMRAATGARALSDLTRIALRLSCGKNRREVRRLGPPSGGSVRRSYLFVPGNRPDRYAKACATRAHAVIVDLEDAVAPADKRSARDALVDWLAEDRRVMVRVN